VYEYRVWCENGDLLMVTTSAVEAAIMLKELRDDCPCGEDDCGVMYEHGYWIQMVEQD